MGKRELKVVRLLEPDLCIDCRFGQIASVRNADGRIEPAIRCRRLDCDNWDFGSAEPLEAHNLMERDG